MPLAASILAMAFAATAQAQTAEDPVDTPEAENQDIVVSAQRRNESIQSVPIAMQAISSEALVERGIRNPQDLGQYTPNVAIASPFGAGSQPIISIRGIGLNDFNTNNAGPNGVYVDEFYVSAPSAQGNSLYDLERVEVLKGPQGTLYGRNTSGGAINFITVKPTQDFGGYLRGEYSSFETVNLEGAVGGGLSETLSARVSGTYNHSRGWMKNLTLNRFENGANNWSARGQLLWEPSSDLKVWLKAQYSKSVARPTVYRLIGTLNPVNFDPVAVLLGAPDKCSAASSLAGDCVDLFFNATEADFYSGNYNPSGLTRIEDFQTILRVDYTAGSVDFTSITGYNFNKRFYPEETDAAPQRILEIDYGTRSREFTQELRASQTGDSFNWVAGLYYLHENLRQEQPLYIYHDLDLLFGAIGSADDIAQTLFTTNVQKTDSFAAYGQAEYEVAPGLRLVGGARYTIDKKDFAANAFFRFQSGGIDSFGPPVGANSFASAITQKKFNWRIAANYKFNPDVMAYASVATGYKSGGFNGGFIVGDQATRDAALRPVKPETVTSYEVGLKSSFLDRKVTLNLAGFYNDYRNQQVLAQVFVNNVIVYTLDNAQKARTYGLDAELYVRPVDGLTLGAQLGLLNSRLVKFVAARDPNQADYSGNRLTFAPSTSLALSADYERDLGGVTIKLHYDTNYRGKQFFDPSNTPYAMQEAYWLHNARIGLEFGDGKYSLGAFARNFTKTKYILTSSDLTLTTGSVQQVVGNPRSFGVDFGVKF